MALPKLNTPTYELILPSTGKAVKYRPFLVKEHKILLTMSEADDNETSRIIRELVDVCTFKELKVSSLPHFDIEYIFMNLRAKSISEKVNVIVTCDCGNKIDTSFSIDDLSIEKDPSHSNKIMLTDNVGIEMSYPNISDVISIIDSNDADKIMNLVESCIKGIFDSENYWEGANQTKEEISDFINSLTKEQFDKIENFFVTAPKIVQNIECECPECGKLNKARLEGLHNFFV